MTEICPTVNPIETSSPAFQRLRAPSRHGEVLAVPDLASAPTLARQNAEALAAADLRIGHRQLGEFREWTKSAVLAAAREWMTDHLGMTPTLTATGELFVTGHQPQLHHAGVWAKNMAIDALAECTHGTGLNLIVDTDLAGSPSVRVPAGPMDEPRFQTIPFDRPHGQQPWEELQLADVGLFESFAQQVTQAMQGWHISPILQNVWVDVLKGLKQSRQPSDLLTICRVAQERRWGMANLELPVSRLAQTEPFLAFVSHVCRDAETFLRIYNQAVEEYRERYRVRNDRHPVPNLEQHGHSIETPFWYWTPGEATRHQLFVERQNGQRLLTANRKPIAELDDPENDIAVLRDLQERGRLRPRALTTTLFSRLFLSDLFIHGIGGARYDEITDVLMERFFEVRPPRYMTVTATLHLPFARPSVASESVRQLRKRLRDLHYNADRHLQGSAVERLKGRRAELVASAAEERRQNLTRSERRRRSAERRKRHRELTAIQDELAQLAQSQIDQTQAALDTALAGERADAILKSREFSAFLFPEEILYELHARVRDLAAGNARQCLPE